MKLDIRDLADRGEPVALMEPMLIGEASSLRPILTDLAHQASVACKRYRGRQPIEVIICCLMTMRRLLGGRKHSSPGGGVKTGCAARRSDKEDRDALRGQTEARYYQAQ